VLLEDLFSAIGFLTIFPVKKDLPFRPQKMIKYFPVVGLLIGIILAFLDLLFTKKLPIGVVSLIDVFLLVVLTGAIHLDGLADTADGLFSHRDKESILKIMKDSRIGTMGALSVFFVLFLKWLSISNLSGNIRFLGLVVVPALSRGSMGLITQFLPYCREIGLGKEFVKKISIFDFIYFIGVWIFLLIFLHIVFVQLFLIFWSVFFFVFLFYKKKLDCITGDMIGALNEVMEAFLFFALIL